MSRSNFSGRKKRLVSSLAIVTATVLFAGGCSRTAQQRVSLASPQNTATPPSLQPQLVVKVKDVEPVQVMQFSRDGKTILTGHYKTDKYGDSRKGTAALWDVRTGKLIKILHTRKPIIAYSPDAKIIAVGPWEGGSSAVELWDVVSGKRKRIVDGGNWAVFAAAFSPDGELLADVEGGDDVSPNGIVIWNARTGKIRKSLLTPNFMADEVAFSADGRTIVATGLDLTASLKNQKAKPHLVLWDVRTGNLTLRKQVKSRNLPAAYRDDVRAISPTNRAVRLLQAESGGFQISSTQGKTSFIKFVLFNQSTKGKAFVDWIAYTPEGYYDGSTGAIQHIRWKVGDKLLPGTAYQSTLCRPDIVRKALSSALNHSVFKQTAAPSHSSLVLTKQELKGKSTHELVLMRNEIFARHGRRFQRSDLQKYFAAQPWYTPRADYSDGLLSEQEKRNAEILLKYQKRNAGS